MSAPFFSRPEREVSIEKYACNYAVRRGWWVCKFVSDGLRGVPDRLFIRAGRHVFIEFKRAGKEPTVQQAKRHREMREHGAEVYCVDRLCDAMEILR